MSYRTQFLQYVENTNGGATKENFVEDWAPIGERMWDELWGAELIEFDDNVRVRLTKYGRAELRAANYTPYQVEEQKS